MRWPFAILLVILPLQGKAQDSPPAWEPPRDISYRRATILSEGTRIAAEVFALADSGETKLPTIVMCHGWGGVARALRPDAVAFARAGYLVVTFDYRGWGQSDSRVILTRPAPEKAPIRIRSHSRPRSRECARSSTRSTRPPTS